MQGVSVGISHSSKTHALVKYSHSLYESICVLWKKGTSALACDSIFMRQLWLLLVQVLELQHSMSERMSQSYTKADLQEIVSDIDNRVCIPTPQHRSV